MARENPILDTELEQLPPDLRWRTWMGRIEAVLFASATPVPRQDLARVVGQGASVDLLIADISSDLAGRPYEIACVADAWMLRTRAQFAPAIRAAADVADQGVDLRASEVAVLAAIAYHQPITRAGLRDIFGKDISRDLLGRLRAQGLTAHGPRSPQPGAPSTFVTTDQFLVLFDLQSLRDLPDQDGPEMDPDLGLPPDGVAG